MIKVSVYSDGTVFIEASGRNSDNGQFVVIAKSYSCIESAELYIEGYRELLGQNVVYIYPSETLEEQIRDKYIGHTMAFIIKGL